MLIEDGCADWMATTHTWNKAKYESLKAQGIDASNYQVPDLRPEELKKAHHHAHTDDHESSSSESSDEEHAHWEKERYHPTYLQKIGFEQGQMGFGQNFAHQYHTHNHWVTWSDDLKKYYDIPHFIYDVASFRDAYLNFDSDWENREPRKKTVNQMTHETLACVTHGEEDFRLVSPAFK